MPGAEEVTYRGEPWFNVGKKTFALLWKDRAVLNLDKAHQDLLFEIRSETFEKCPVGTSYWSYVSLERVEEAELANLVCEAWSRIVPKRVSRPILAARKVGAAD